MMRSPFLIASVANTPLPWIGDRRASIFLTFFFFDISDASATGGGIVACGGTQGPTAPDGAGCGPGALPCSRHHAATAACARTCWQRDPRGGEPRDKRGHAVD